MLLAGIPFHVVLDQGTEISGALGAAVAAQRGGWKSHASFLSDKRHKARRVARRRINDCLPVRFRTNQPTPDALFLSFFFWLRAGVGGTASPCAFLKRLVSVIHRGGKGHGTAGSGGARRRRPHGTSGRLRGRTPAPQGRRRPTGGKLRRTAGGSHFFGGGLR